ncbi:hypothetical protein N7533_000271 [Penicillium manginii]|uniref:uncharacterized protein n=1 Tax=Penicillium manginii TaxID=203109 RepID=UPI0025479394|nr:uncharacterized protein N7533_000271 [Penicillium manginii]KAJ5767688.1 hypothetical protein N7533_000271 [Penicillium manginii]
MSSERVLTCETYTVRLQPQHNLDVVGFGAAGQVYNVSDQIVLKTSMHIEATFGIMLRTHYFILDERTVLQQLQNRPHPHIIQAKHTNQPEGLYLRKYRQLPLEVKSAQARRITLYRDIANALRHLHSLGIARRCES